ncbi:ycaC protein [Coprinopsis marcescibilis]|nr:ycaC protein [Coprinopsis marcescibilis]
MSSSVTKALLLCLAIAQAALVSGYEYVRLNKSDVALLIVDHQVGLFHIVRDWEPQEFRSNIFAHATFGQVFGLPTVITTSIETGPNGPVPKEILDMHPNAPVIRRQGEINAWDNQEFRDAVYATGKKQILLAGITTDVCTAFVAMSLVEANFTVFANADASGTFNQRIADDANDRMRAAGVQVVSNFAIGSELLRDWRGTPSIEDMMPLIEGAFPSLSWLTRSFAAASGN